MIRVFIRAIYIILTALVIAYIDNGIRTYDMDFYHGKDNGYFLRFESIIILNTIFYMLMINGKKHKLITYLKQGGIGFLTAVIIGIAVYLIFAGVDSYGLTYHIATIIVCYSSYFRLKMLKLIKGQAQARKR